MKKKRLAVLGLAVVLAFCATACGTEEEESAAEVLKVEAEKPQTGEVTLETAYMGTVSPFQQVYVTPLVSGTVTEVHVKVGDSVQKGDILFKIDDETAQLQKKNAQASYSQAAAGATAATGGSRELQNFQTEQSIETLRDSWDEVQSTIDELNAQLGQIDESSAALQTTRAQVQAPVDAAQQTYDQLEQQRVALETQKAAIDADIITKEAENADEATVLAPLRQQADALAVQLDALKPQIDAASSALDLAKSQAEPTLTDLDEQLANLASARTSVQSGLDTATSSQKTIETNLDTTEGAYAITKEKVYPQTDATYAAQLQSAALGIESADMQLDYYSIEAPISGVLDSVAVEAEQMASAGNVACIISDKESMTVTFYVTEAVRASLSTGDAIRVEAEEELEGTITEIGTMANTQTKLFEVKATVPEAGDVLVNGTSVKLQVVTERENDKLSIPYDALYFTAGDAYVYCLENGALVKTDVTVGLMNDERAVIEEGLQADSMVVTSWSGKLRDGAEAALAASGSEDEGEE